MKKSAAVTEALPVSSRRLDELAWLLEGSSMCVATAVAGNRFYLAANEFSSRTQSVEKNKKLETICAVMEYLSAIAKGKPGSVEERSRMRDGLMKKIIKQQISTSTLGRINIPDRIFDEIITSEVLHLERLPREFKEKDMAYIALGYGLLVNSRIRKLETSIEAALKGDFSGISAEQLSAFKAFNHDDSNRSGSNILFLEPKIGVHAEMQILSEVLKMIEKETREARKEPREFYIGISKRCCLDCDTMLQAANEVLQHHNISIRYEGAHGAAFSDKWVCPAIFIPAQEALAHAVSKKAKNESELGEEEEEEKTVFSLIYEKYREKIAARQGGAADSYSQRHSVSSSDYSSNPEERLSAYRDRLEGDLGVIKRLGVKTLN